jgi:DNA-binding LytR/AlgR family response regulator
MSKIRAVIVDDEPAAIDVIKELSEQLTTDVQVVAIAMNGLDAMKAIIEHQPDLVFLDIDMPLMNGLEVIEKLPQKKFRIVFTTGSAAYAFKAIKLAAIDYLLKPIDPADFLLAIDKVRSFLAKNSPDKKMRLLIRKGTENISKPVEEIALFYTENRIVYVIDKTGKKFMIDKNMNELEAELDPAIFFRANRQYIVNLHFIKYFKPYEKVKLWLELDVRDLNQVVIISQKSAPEFRSWISAL